jgi:hypothetical protein
VSPGFTVCGRKNRIRKTAKKVEPGNEGNDLLLQFQLLHPAMQHEDNGFEKDLCHTDIRSSGHGEILEEFEFLVAVRRYRILPTPDALTCQWTIS